MEDRRKLAMLIALCFSSRLTGLAPDFLFTSLLNDSLVSKGSSLSFLTDFFRFYLAETSMEELVGLLKRGKVEQRLVDFFPSGKRSPDAFAQHFKWVPSFEGSLCLLRFSSLFLRHAKPALAQPPDSCMTCRDVLLCAQVGRADCSCGLPEEDCV